MFKTNSREKKDRKDWPTYNADWKEYDADPDVIPALCQARVRSANYLSSQIRTSDLDSFINRHFMAL